MGVNASSGQRRRDLELAREMEEIQRNAMATYRLSELIEVNIVTGASVRYGYEYFQIS